MKANRMLRWIVCAALAALLCTLSLSALADGVTLPNYYGDAIKYIQSHTVTDCQILNGHMSPGELLKIRAALPSDAKLTFVNTWNKVKFTDDTESLNFQKCEKNISKTELEQLIELLPNLKSVDTTTLKKPTNEVMIEIIEKYPDIHFDWNVHLAGEHYCPSNATAYSTFNYTDAGRRLKDEDLELLQYIPGLKALDLGHNAFHNLDFLRFFPDLEFLIITNNSHLTDISALGELKHLKYLELYYTDVTVISPLANCTELIDLNISCTKIKDFSPLDEITTLNRFYANNIKKLPQEQEEHFIALHPDCEVNFHGDSAICGTWRNHPRYYHFRWCLKHNQWYSFDELIPGHDY